MPSIRRADRVARSLQQELDRLLRREVRDPRVGEVTVTRVTLTDDLREATVLVQPFGKVGDPERGLQLMEGLKKTRGFLQAKVGRNLRLRVVPKLQFELDRGFENLVHMHDVIENLRKPGASDDDAATPEEGTE